MATLQFQDVKVEDYPTHQAITAILPTTDSGLANMVRRAILSEIETYSIEYLSLDFNNSARDDELLAMRLGLVPIDHSRYTQGHDYTFSFDISGPGDFTTDALALPFLHRATIVKLREGERVAGRCTVKKGTAKVHAKWSPVSTVAMTPTPDGHYQFVIKSVGMLSATEILTQGLAKIEAATNRPPINLFSRPLPPL